MPNTGPSEGSRRQIAAFLPILLSASPQAYGRGRLPFAGRRRADRGHQDQLAVFPARQAVDVIQRYFRLVMPVWLQLIFGDAEFFGDLGDAQHLRFLGDFDIG